MIKIWYYKHLTRKLRRKAGLPELYDIDDLPDPMFDPNYVHVLTDNQQYELHHGTFCVYPRRRLTYHPWVPRAKEVYEVSNLVSPPWD